MPATSFGPISAEHTLPVGSAHPDRLHPDDRLVRFLQSHGAARMRHGHGRTLLDHLIGTRDLVARWDQPDWMQRAALIHSVYGTDAYRQQMVPLSSRETIIQMAGARAERLAYLFCVTSRGRIFAEAESRARRRKDHIPDDVREPSEPRNPTDPTDPGVPTGCEIDGLVLLHMANLAEQSQESDGSPGQWLAKVGALASALSGGDVVVPRALVRGMAHLTEEQERNARDAYLSGIAEFGNPSKGGVRLAQVIAVCPALPEPFVWLAYDAWRRHDRAATQWWASEARTRLAELGTVWDKRVTFRGMVRHHEPA